MKKTLLAAAAMAALVTIGDAGPGWALPVLEFTGGMVGPTSQFAATASAGWSFTTNQAISVTALDAYDPMGTGAGVVRLYNGMGTVLASATVTTGDPKEGTSPSSFYSHAISAVSLMPGTYYIAEDLAGTTMAYVMVTGMTTASAIKYDGEVSAMGQGMNPTSDALGGALNPGIFGPNFDIAAVGAPVPEPASFMLLGTGLLVLLGAALNRHRRHPDPA